MPEGPVKCEGLKSVKKELKAVFDVRTYIRDTLNPGETSTPVMEIVTEPSTSLKQEWS